MNLIVSILTFRSALFTTDAGQDGALGAPGQNAQKTVELKVSRIKPEFAFSVEDRLNPSPESKVSKVRINFKEEGMTPSPMTGQSFWRL